MSKSLLVPRDDLDSESDAVRIGADTAPVRFAGWKIIIFKADRSRGRPVKPHLPRAQSAQTVHRRSRENIQSGQRNAPRDAIDWQAEEVDALVHRRLREQTVAGRTGP